MTMLPKHTVLNTERLVLRAFEDGDMAAVLRIFDNDDVKQTYMLPDFEDRSKAEALFRRMQAISLMPDRIDYAITLNGQCIGFLNDCGIEGECIELGYVIHPDHQGNGYATEALAAVIGELFRMGYRCIQAAHFSQNPASGRVMQKCGMRRTGKTEIIEYRGKTHSCLYYEITNDPK